jgi:Protein of unknown function (DUF2917)
MDRYEHLVHGVAPLARGGIMRIEEGQDMRVHVLDGAAWITQERDSRDHYVPARSSFRITNAGRTLISAVGHASIAVTSPHEPVENKLGARLARIWAALHAPHARPTTAGL